MATPAEIEHAAELLRAGKLVAVPTETVYGLAADATNEDAVAAVFAAKGRPAEHPLIVHLAGADWLREWVGEVPPLAEALAGEFWPGPLSLIVPRGSRIPRRVTGGRDTVAVRVPGHPVTRAILEALGRPVAAPSANPFGRISPTTAQHVRDTLGDAVAMVVDGGPCDVGVESTIVDVTGSRPALVRPGSITPADIERVAKTAVDLRTEGEISAPGTLPAHYAPRARLIVVDRSELAERANALASEGHRVGALVSPEDANDLALDVIVAPMSLDVNVAARQLYAGLRLLDARDCDVIVAAWPEPTGIGIAIADRLRRAKQGHVLGSQPT